MVFPVFFALEPLACHLHGRSLWEAVADVGSWIWASFLTVVVTHL